jgi:NADH:ubiquinone oxidoreductase subunit H
MILLTVLFTLGTINLLDILAAQLPIALFYALFPIALLFILSAVAETNRAPFDLPEAESELVAGFFTEHSAISFAYFYLGEYTTIIMISTLFFILFFGLSTALPLILLFIWLRCSLARIRFDQLLRLGWSHILPFTIAIIIFLPPFLLTFTI